MNLSEIKELIAVLDKSTLSVLEVREGDSCLRLERPTGPVQAVAVAAQPIAAAATAPDAAPEGYPGAKTLLSPMVGTFHMLEDRPLTIGTTFKKGDVLCVIEAMKLMNDIVAEEDGEVLWLALSDNDFIEYGQIIVQYQPL